ncbi:MAG: rhamnogalacturonan acetylesterase [Candidatus Marinimicrobia bacterium]|nr:rhamnogalacturonan acetylesterase [Candidatus Neomarinimicrobiota bacterium]
MANYRKYFSIPFCLLIVAVIINVIAAAPRVTIHLIGDSTMADKPLDDNPERGWGQLFPLFFTQDVRIINYARNGRSTKSFIDQGLWDEVHNNLRPGDYLFIQFGHNDAKKSDTIRYAEAHTNYRSNLVKYITEAHQKDATPVLITPVNRRKFSETGEFFDQHGDYPKVVRELASEYNVPLIDLHASSMHYLSALGPEKSEALFLRAPAGVYKRCPEGKSDNTHFNRYGAIQICKLVIDAMQPINLPIVKYLKEGPELSDIGIGKVVGLDYFYNHEFRDGRQYHYIWEDRENSGFYELGNLYENTGAFISEVKEAPTAAVLEKLSVYIIVDPDTPKETAEPNYISPAAIKNITKWVRSGGVLVLLANDKGNAEFEHFNHLAQKFGIRFNEVSLNRVENKNYNMAKFDDLPDHPLFENLSKIYMKEVASLTLSGKARPILNSDGNIIIAMSEYGNGVVLAIGDPWFYNEYIDDRRLPADFENFQAAKNFVNWSLNHARVVRDMITGYQRSRRGK